MHISRISLQNIPREPKEGDLNDSRRAFTVSNFIDAFWVDTVVWVFVVFFFCPSPSSEAPEHDFPLAD